MNLYTFEYDGYGESYSVVASSEEEALLSVKLYLRAKAELEKVEEGSDYDQCTWGLWEKAALNSLPANYSIKVLKPGQVLETEAS